MKTFVCKQCGEVFSGKIKEIDEEELEGTITKSVEDCPFCNPEKYYNQEDEDEN